jgi:hypothetical protein
MHWDNKKWQVVCNADNIVANAMWHFLKGYDNLRPAPKKNPLGQKFKNG